MHFPNVIKPWIVCVYLIIATCGAMIGLMPAQANAQALESVLLEAPKPLGDVRNLRREPDPEQLKIVSERLDPELRAVSIRWRGFELFPLLKTTATIDDNIYATDNDTESDFITTINPSIFVRKEYRRHNFGFLAEADYNKYFENTDEDTLNFKTRFNALLEARHNLTFPFEVSYRQAHEGRGQNFSTNFSVEPIQYNVFGTAFGFNYNPNRLEVAVLGRYSDLSFEDGENRLGTDVVRRDADRSAAEIEASVSYDIAPNHRPFASVSVTDVDYKRGDFQSGSFSGPQRDNKGVNVMAGWELAYKGLVEGFVSAGYGTRDYSDSSIKDVDSVQLSSDISWNVTKRATLNLALNRTIAEDNQVLNAAVVSHGRLKLDYEVLHNAFFNAFAERAMLDFQDSSREDDIMGLGFGMRYVLNPRYSVSGDYRFRMRDSNAAGLDYDRHQFMVRLNSRF